MPTLMKNMVYDSNPGNFNLWADDVSTALATLGWVKTPDTGQINTAVIATITNVSQSGTTATITTSAAHGLSSGANIGIALLTHTSLNGCWGNITVIDGTNFSFTLPTGTIASVADSGLVVPLVAVATINNVSQSTTTATLTYSNAAGAVTIPVSENILVTGLSHTALNGTQVTATVPTATTLTMTVPTGTIASVADTGTIWMAGMPGTVASLTTGLMGYQIWRMADALQSTSPVFMKIEFGRSTSSNCPRVAITLGTGSNGSGQVNGVTTTRQFLSGGTVPQGVTTFLCYFSGDVNRLAMALWQALGATQNTAPIGFQLERSHDTTGADTGTYVTLFVIANSPFLQSIFPVLGSATTPETAIPVLLPAN